MPGIDIDPLTIERGTITAPAGCGKTHLIADALTRHNGSKPILVLTHTNAGVAALRGRLQRAHVKSSSYRLSTIDGWAMRLVSTFPTRSASAPAILLLNTPSTDYPKVRAAAAQLIEAGHVDDVIQASYARLLVDEYQDCSIKQHSIVRAMATTLPTCVFGDPLQAIFGFGADGLAKWAEDVCASFPVVGSLDKPWRWINAGAEELGRWLLEARAKLLRGDPIDLLSAPGEVQWVELDGREDHQRRLIAARVLPPGGKGTVLIIDDSVSPASQRAFASQTPGAITVEAVDLKDLVSFARRFDFTASDALKSLTEFAESVMTNVGGADLLRRVATLRKGSARKAPSAVETAALEFVAAPCHDLATDLLVEIGRESGVRTHRPAVLRACLKALQLCVNSPALSFHDAAIQMREQNRLIGRPLPRKAVGSTLLLKGLESDVAVILKADSLDARNLYVAMTRGSKKLTICSSKSLLKPR